MTFNFSPCTGCGGLPGANWDNCVTCSMSPVGLARYAEWAKSVDPQGLVDDTVCSYCSSPVGTNWEYCDECHASPVGQARYTEWNERENS